MWDIDSPWTNLYYLTMAAMVIGWIIAGVATVAAAVAIPYLAAIGVSRLARRRRNKSSRPLIIATFATIILLAAAVVGLAYATGTHRKSEPDKTAASIHESAIREEESCNANLAG